MSNLGQRTHPVWPPRVLPPMAHCQPSPTSLAPPPHDHRLRDPAGHARWRCGCPALHGPDLTTTPRDPFVVLACEGAPGPCPAPTASAYPLEPRSRWATSHPSRTSPSKPRESLPRLRTTSTSTARYPQHASNTGRGYSPILLLRPHGVMRITRIHGHTAHPSRTCSALAVVRAQ